MGDYRSMYYKIDIKYIMQAVSQQFVQKAIQQVDGAVTCEHFHEGMTCNSKAFSQFVSSVRSCSKMYFLAHLIPFLLFKRKKVRQNPVKEVLKLLLAFTKSMIFAGGYTMLVRRAVCLISKNYKFTGLSNFWAAILAGVTLNFEPISRQSEIALYCLNKSMEVCYLLAKRRNWPVRVPHGECLLVLISTGLICYHYMNNRESIRDSYLKVLDKLLAEC